MTINRTALLDLPLPVTGTEAGVWGDITNNGLSQYLDIAIAGRNALTSANFTAGALTIDLTEGTASATNIAAGSAQYATLYVSSLAANSTITAPSSNRAYRVVNADATYTLTIKASGQTGVTFPVSTSGVVVFNGTDYVLLGTFAPIFNVDNLRLDGNTISTTNSNGNLIVAPNGTGYVVFSGTQAILIPKGNNTTERPGTPVTGMLRYNTTSEEFEGYSGASPSWKSVGGAAISNDTATASDLFPTFVSATTGTASTLNTSNAKLLYKPSTGELKASAPVASNGILVNSTTMTTSYTIATGTNGLSVGPFTINSGVILTIDSGQRHLIL